MKPNSPHRNPNAQKNVLKELTSSHTKSGEFNKIFASIHMVTNFYQIEPIRQLVDLFGKKHGDRAMQQELLNSLYNKAGDFALE